MLAFIGVIQALVFCFFFLLERIVPGRVLTKATYWDYWFIGIGIFALFWLRLVLYIWLSWDVASLFNIAYMSLILQGIVFYFFYSFGNYWFHRWKHSYHFLWHILHKFHHSPSHMETRVAFYRHPLEIFANTLYLLFIGKLIFGVNAEVIAIALAIEGCLECFHHSNIKIPMKLRWIGYIIQIPEMHLVHHERGLHRYNYAPFLWDSIFGTVYIPTKWNKQLGFANSHRIDKFFLLK